MRSHRQARRALGAGGSVAQWPTVATPSGGFQAKNKTRPREKPSPTATQQGTRPRSARDQNQRGARCVAGRPGGHGARGRRRLCAPRALPGHSPRGLGRRPRLCPATRRWAKAVCGAASSRPPRRASERRLQRAEPEGGSSPRSGLRAPPAPAAPPSPLARGAARRGGAGPAGVSVPAGRRRGPPPGSPRKGRPGSAAPTPDPGEGAPALQPRPGCRLPDRTLFSGL